MPRRWCVGIAGIELMFTKSSGLTAKPANPLRIELKKWSRSMTASCMEIVSWSKQAYGDGSLASPYGHSYSFRQTY